MQIRSIALAAVALAASQAQALTIPAGAPVLYVSGSSALTPVIKGIFATNCATAVTTLQNKSTGADQFMFTCTLTASSSLAKAINGGTAPASGQTVYLFKRDAGGSAYGVNPVAASTAVAFLDEAGATDASGNYTGTKNVVPQLGAADVEPALLQESNNLAAGFTALTAAQLGGLNTQTVLLQSFGVAVNNNLYTALQTAQNTTGVPSIPTTFLQSLVNKGGLNIAAASWGHLLNNSDASQINICRRAAGSGTQAGANLLFTPFNEAALGAADSDATAVGTEGIVYVSEGGSTGAVKTCLNSADTTAVSATYGHAAYAIGYIGYENKPAAGTDTWKFVNLDGNSPDIGNTQNGLYSYAFENTFNYLKTLSGAPLNFINGILGEAKNPAVIATLSTNLKTAAIDVSSSLATRSGNSRNPLKVVK